MPNKRILISTITPESGGVPTMTRFVVKTLRKNGFEPVIGHYEPYSVTPSLSSTLLSMGLKAPGMENRMAFGDVETHAIGTWFPEFEFTHYAPTSHWKSLIDSCDGHLVVSGNILPATHYMRLGFPFLAWVATGWREDRVDRVARFPWYRKLLDKVVNSPVLARLERSLLASGTVLALSNYTKKVLNEQAGQLVCRDVLPMPVDTEEFSPTPTQVEPFLIGFTGRTDDPRKNIGLLLEALPQLRKKYPLVKARLIGGNPTREHKETIERLGLENDVEFFEYMQKDELIAELRRFDVFVLPSHQEGLCISALEAMACGCPVVSTRCGGPEEFVIDDHTGYLARFDADDLADAIHRVIGEKAKRNQLSVAARELVLNRYSINWAESIFWNGFYHTFPALGKRTL